MKGIFGIVSCDVIDSTSLEMDELIRLRKDVYSELFPNIEGLYPGFWGRVVRGDTIECCLEQPEYAFRAALLIKCWFKDWAVKHHASEQMRKSGIRYSIGIGSMRMVDRKEDFMDGEAIYIAGRNLDYITRKGIPAFFGMNSDNKDVNELIISNLLLVDNLIESSTERQLPILHERLYGLTETEISRKLQITQGAVNQRARGAGWPLIKDTLNVLEHIDYEWYVE